MIECLITLMIKWILDRRKKEEMVILKTIRIIMGCERPIYSKSICLRCANLEEICSVKFAREYYVISLDHEVCTVLS